MISLTNIIGKQQFTYSFTYLLYSLFILTDIKYFTLELLKYTLIFCSS